MTKKDRDEIAFWQKAKRKIIAGYGKGCEVFDVDEGDLLWPRKEWLKTKPSELINCPSRCGACKAKEVLLWMDRHIDLLKM